MPDASATIIYENPLATAEDVADFRLEGQAQISFPNGRLRMENALAPEMGQAANFVYWCPLDFPDHIAVTWDFYPVREPGLCIIFFAATGRRDASGPGCDLFDASLATRTGEYPQYHHGDMNALHLSYFRRTALSERAFQTCNLRKSYGFHLVAQGADPLPSVVDALPPYHMELIKRGPHVHFAINDLVVLTWTDDAQHGPPLAGGKIGFRQMAPLIGEYANLRVRTIPQT